MEARLVQLLRDTFTELDDLWRSIGLSAKERSEQVESLFKDTCELCRVRIATEKALAASYEEEVRRLKEDIAICAERLDVVRVVPPTTEKLPLVRELTSLRGDYEELDRKRAELENAMTVKLGLLHKCWDEMNTTYEAGFEAVGFKLSAKRMNEIEHKYEEVKKERERRLALVQSRVGEASQLLEMLELDEQPATSFDHAIISRNIEAIGLGSASIDALDKRIIELQTERQSKEALMMRLINEIQSLWQRMGVPEIERESFIRRHGTLGEKSIRAYEAKLEELKELRRQRMSEFISKVRAEIRDAMDEARLPSSERSRLMLLLNESIVAEEYEQCSQLLARHEQEIDKLKVVLEAVRPIVKLCQKYLQQCQERIEYEALIQDTSRLMSRKRTGPSLQEEEKMRRRVKVEMPKNITQLKQLVDDFEKNFLAGDKLTLGDILGEDRPVVQVIEDTEREHEERLQREKEQRQNKKLEQDKGPHTTQKKTTVAAASTVKRVPMKPKN